MKKYLIVLMVLFISCGPSEAEIQAQIDQAVEEALEVAEETTTTITSTTSSSTTTSTSLTTTSTTTTQLLTPLISIDTCPSEVSVPDGFLIEYSLIARSSDIELLNIKEYYDGKLEFENFYTNNELDLPKAGKSSQFNSKVEYTVNRSKSYKFRAVYEVTNQGGLTFTESCSITINPKPVQTTTTTIASVKSYPPDPGSDTWLRFSGTNSGSVLIDLSDMSPGPKIAHVEYTGSDYFNIKSYDSGNNYINLDIAHIGNFVGDIPINFDNEQYFSLQVEGDGTYEIVIKPVSASINFDEPSISRTGYAVIEAYDLEIASKKITFEYVGDDYVSVKEYKCDGDYHTLAVSEIGNYTGTYLSRKGTCYLVIQAETGTWTISK